MKKGLWIVFQSESRHLSSPWFFLRFHFPWREGQGTVLSPIPTASLCRLVHIYSLAASTLEGAACNTKRGCGYGCVGALPGSPAGPGRPPILNTPLWGHWGPLSVEHHLWWLPWVQPQCHCKKRRWKDTKGVYSARHLLFFTLVLRTKASFHLGFYSCLFFSPLTILLDPQAMHHIGWACTYVRM